MMEETTYGFKWGQLEVERTYELPNTMKVVTIRTPRRTMKLYVTPTGLIRVFTKPGDEWRPAGRKERHGRISS